MNNNILNILKGALSFLWLFPYFYMLMDIYLVLDNRISSTAFKYLIILSCLSAVILLVIWYIEFTTIGAIVKAFNCLNNDDYDNIRKYLRYNPSNYEQDGKPLLQKAIDDQKDPQLIELLISDGFRAINTYDVNYNISYTLFYLCAYYNYLNEGIVNFLIQEGANINFVDSTQGFSGLSLVQTLVLRESKKSIELLLNSGADLHYVIPELSMDALMLAAKHVQDPMIVSLLINYGANIRAKSVDGYNAILYCAHYNSNPVIANILVKAGAMLKPYSVFNEIFKGNNVTPLFVASMLNHNPKMIEMLITLGDDIGYKDNTGMNCLFVASTSNPNVDVIKTLLYYGGDLDRSRDNDGNTPLMGASFLNPNPLVIRYVLERTHNLQTKNKDGLDFIDFLRQNKYLDQEQQDVIINKWI